MKIETKSMFQYKRYSLIIFSIILYITGITLYSIISIDVSKKNALNQIDERLKVGAYSTYYLLEKDFFKRAKEKDSISLEEDWRNINKLTAFNNHAKLAFIYVTIKKDKNIYVISSSATQKELDKKEELHYFYHYNTASDKLKKTFNNNQATSDEYIDEWGHFRSIFIPVKIDENNTIVLAAEVDIGYLNKALQEIQQKLIFEGILYLLLILPFVMSVYYLIGNLKEFYVNTINSVDNLIFVKDTGFKYIECNKAFELFVGISRDGILGKTDYALFEKDVADLFREHDTKVLLEKKSRSNIEWLTYPNGEKFYTLVVKSPLADSKGNIIGLVGNSADFTKQKEMSDALVQSEKSLNLIIETSPIGICTFDLLGNFISTNPAYEKMLGYSKKELNKLSFFDITRPSCSPENKKLFQKIFSLKASAFDMEKIYIRKDSKEINVNVHVTGVSDETGNRKFGTSFVENITEKKYNLMLLEQKKEELETIIQEAPNPIMVRSEDGKVLMLNKVWEQLTGYSYDEINTTDKWIKKAYSKTMPGIKKHIDDLFLLNHNINQGEHKIKTKDGNIIIWQFSSAPLGIVDGKKTIITSAMDITELKHKDEMLIKQSRHAAMGEMISMIAHQWRQPLSVISMDANNILLDIAMGDLDVNASEEYANSIVQQTQHLSGTIDDFRNFFKPDKAISKINIRDTINKTLSMVADSLKSNSIKLKSTFETEKQVDAYPRELMQVFVNIITNAKDALISNKSDVAQINIRVYENEKYVNTEICDNGGGIDADTLPKVFDPYFSTKNEKNGTGLGLHMSKMIIEEHLHGKIEVKNKNEGACFTVSLLKNNLEE